MASLRRVLTAGGIFASRSHPGIDFDEERFGFLELLLPGQRAPQHALRVKEHPVVRQLLLADRQAFAQVSFRGRVLAMLQEI